MTNEVDQVVRLAAIAPRDDTATFETFYATQRRSVLGLAYALSGSQLAAEDLAQEAFLAAYRRWDDVSKLDNPGAWVRRVVANRSVSLFRKRMAEAKALLRLGGAAAVAMPDLPPDSEVLWKAVRRLPKRQSQCVALHYLDGLSMPEIALVLNCSKESVNTHLRRARRTLALRLGLQEEL